MIDPPRLNISAPSGGSQPSSSPESKPRFISLSATGTPGSSPTPSDEEDVLKDTTSSREKKKSKSIDKKHPNTVYLLDVYQSSADYANAVKAGQRDTFRQGQIIGYLWKAIRNFVFLAMLGTITGISAAGFDALVTLVVDWRNDLSFPLFLVFVMFVTTIAPLLTVNDLILLTH